MNAISPPDSLLTDNSLLEVLKTRQKELKRMAEHYELELKKINAAFKILADNCLKRVRWTSETINCFREKNEVLKTTDILFWIFRNDESELSIPKKRRIYLTGLSVALNNLVTGGKICKIMLSGQKGFFYGLEEWFENDRKTLKSEFMQSFELRLKKNKA